MVAMKYITGKLPLHLSSIWIRTHNKFVRQLEFYIAHSSRYGYTSVSLCIPCECFNQYEDMKTEMKNFYAFLKSYLYSKGISMNWAKENFMHGKMNMILIASMSMSMRMIVFGMLTTIYGVQYG